METHSRTLLKKEAAPSGAAERRSWRSRGGCFSRDGPARDAERDRNAEAALRAGLRRAAPGPPARALAPCAGEGRRPAPSRPSAEERKRAPSRLSAEARNRTALVPFAAGTIPDGSRGLAELRASARSVRVV